MGALEVGAGKMHRIVAHTSEAGKASGPVMPIVAVLSVKDLQSFAGLGAYCGSKAAIDHIARVGAHDI